MNNILYSLIAFIKLHGRNLLIIVNHLVGDSPESLECSRDNMSKWDAFYGHNPVQNRHKSNWAYGPPTQSWSMATIAIKTIT